jgi:hypothetical protein
MTATTVARKAKGPSGEHPIVDRYGALPIAASTKLLDGIMVGADLDGNIVSAELALRVLGRVNEKLLESIDNTSGSAGDLKCDVDVGIFPWENSAGDEALSAAHVGHVCYAVDNQTVSLSSSRGTRPIAGVVYKVDSYGVWVNHGAAFYNHDHSIDIAVPAAADYSAKQYHAMDIASGKATEQTTEGGPAIGFLQNKPAAADAIAIVRVFGISMAKADDTVTPGAHIAVSDGTAGTVKVAVAGTIDISGDVDGLVGSHVLGRSLKATNAVAAEVFPVLVNPEGVIPTTAA